MTGLISPAARAALAVAKAAVESPASAYGICDAVVFALDSAQLLQSPETATAHAAEVDRWQTTAASWRRRYYTEAGVRWDDELPPGGEVCAECGQPVESEPCYEHNPRAALDLVRAERNRFADRIDALTAELKKARTEAEQQLAASRHDALHEGADAVEGFATGAARRLRRMAGERP